MTTEHTHRINGLGKCIDCHAHPLRPDFPPTGREHQWRLTADGDVDEFAYDGDTHNGPVCEVCKYPVCHHCVPDYRDLRDCPGPETEP